MSDQPIDLSLSQQIKVDSICVRFEESWQGGEPPSIESFLEDVDPDAASHLFIQLLLIELEYLERSGERPSAACYLSRFPTERPLVRQALDRHSQAPVLDTSQPRRGHAAENIDPASLDERPGVEIDRYKLLEQIGEGGMGVVYLAEQRRPVRRKVALKIIKPGMDTRQVVARFEAERQALALMDHAHIARVFDAGSTASGRPYFVMELVQGVSITDYCDENRLGVRERLRIFTDVCRAVQHAHTKGIIHRDLKPSNVLVAIRDDAAVPKIIDFGVAKATGGQLTEQTLFTGTTQLLGTPLYMSPEQAEMRGVDVDTRSDIYSLGVLLYELLTGATLFDRDRLHSVAPDEMRRIIREEDPDKPSSRISTMGSSAAAVAASRSTDRVRLKSQLRGELDWIVMKAIDKDRARRYETAAALAADVTRHLEGSPVEACPPSTIYLLGKFVRRYQAPVTVAVGFLSLLLASSVVSWSLYADARRSRDKAVAVQADLTTERDRAVSAERIAEENLRSARRAEQDAQWQLYRANIVATTAALDRGNPAGARQLLQECPAEHRDWEWRHLQAQLDTSAFVLGGHDDVVCSAHFCAAGTRVASCSLDHTVRLWDARSGAQIAVLDRHEGPVRRLCSNVDGTRLASTSYDDTVRIWDALTGEQLAILPADYSFLTFHPDGVRLATASMDSGLVRLWDTSSGELLGQLPLPSVKNTNISRRDDGKPDYASHVTWDWDPIPILAFSPDGARLATTSTDRELRLWDPDTLTVVAELEGHYRTVDTVKFSADSARLVTGSQSPDHSMRLWDTQTGELITTMEGHRNTVRFAEFSPSGDRIVSASYDATLRLWDGRSGAPITVLDGHRDRVEACAFSPDGLLIGSASLDHTVRFWDGNTGAAMAVLGGHLSRVYSVEFSPDGSQAVSASSDNTARVWDVTANVNQGVLKGHESYVYAVDFTPDGSQVASASWDGTVRMWDVASGRQVAQFSQPEPSQHADVIQGVAISPDGKRVAAGLGDCTVRVWEIDTRRMHVLGRPGFRKFQSPVLFTPDGRRVAYQGGDGSLRLGSVDTPEETTVAMFSRSEIEGMDLHPSGDQLAVASTLGSVRVVHTESGELLTELHGHVGEVNAVAYHPRGDWLATAGSEKVLVWDVDRRETIAELKHPGPIHAVAFNPDGTRLATGSADKLLRIWDVATWDLVADLQGHDDYIHSVAFSPDGTRLATGSGDHTVRIWSSFSLREGAGRRLPPTN